MAKKVNNNFNFYLIIILLICIIIGLVYNQYKSKNKNKPIMTYSDSLSPRLPTEESNIPIKLVQDSKDTVRNPYAPPIRYYEDTYKQLGFLSNHSTKLILFGKPAHYRRDKWYYYTIIDDIKLPIEINKRKCTVQPGCDSVSTKDIVIVDGKEYMVNLYETELY
jgi:hypothetical protein